MLPREDTGAGLAAGRTLPAAVAAGFWFCAFFPAVGGAGIEAGLLAVVFDFALLADFLTGFLAAFFAAGLFFATFWTAFLPDFTCFAARLLFVARFFNADVLAARERGDFAAFFARRFLAVF